MSRLSAAPSRPLRRSLPFVAVGAATQPAGILTAVQCPCTHKDDMAVKKQNIASSRDMKR